MRPTFRDFAFLSWEELTNHLSYVSRGVAILSRKQLTCSMTSTLIKTRCKKVIEKKRIYVEMKCAHAIRSFLLESVRYWDGGKEGLK